MNNKLEKENKRDAADTEQSDREYIITKQKKDTEKENRE